SSVCFTQSIPLMSTNTTKNMGTTSLKHDPPPCLLPCEPFEDWSTCVDSEIHKPAAAFSRQFGVPKQIAVACVHSAVANSLGSSIVFMLPHRHVAPPFSLLTVSPDIDPIWSLVPLRFLRGELEDYF